MAAEMTDEQRKAIGARLKAGRAAKAAQREQVGADQLIDTTPTSATIQDAVISITSNWIADQPEPAVYALATHLREASETVQRRLQIIEAKRNEAKCSACGKPLHLGRSVGDIPYRDLDKGADTIVNLRACSVLCYQRNQEKAESIRRRGAGSQRGVMAI